MGLRSSLKFYLLTVCLNYTFTVGAEGFSFDNFDMSLIVTKGHADREWTITGLEEFQISSGRLIVKTVKSGYQADALMSVSGVKSLKLAYSGQDFEFYVLERKHAFNLSEMINSLNKLPSVLLVQPDIRQSGHKHALLFKRSNEIVQTPVGSVVDPSLKGNDVVVAVIDDGIDLTHSAFNDTTIKFSYDVTAKVLDASPKQALDTHGTKTAGIIFANDNVVQGIAPKADLVAIRQPDMWTSNTLIAFQIANLMKSDIINCSWTSHFLLQPISDVVADLAKHGRNGKGTAIFFAAGNQGVRVAPQSTEAAIDEAIVVGALNKAGTIKLKTSNFGDSIDIWVPANEHQTTMPNNRYGWMSGTSLAAAKASGVAAVILQSNPELTLAQLENEIRNSYFSKKFIKSGQL